MGISRSSESPGRCLALTAGSREKTADAAVRIARPPASRQNGERRLAGKRRSRMSEAIQTAASRPKTA